MREKLAVIFANGQLDNPGWITELVDKETFLVAADGGYHHLTRIGLTPHLLIGDLDSVTAEDVNQAEEAGCEVLRFPPEKDETDLELALLEVVRRGYQRIVVVAGLGGRLDQTLSNVYLLNLPQLSGCDVRLDDGVEEVMLIKNELQIIGQAGDTVSLLPISPIVEKIKTEGLDYPLVDEDLIFFRSRGISNVMTGNRARVVIQNGILLCIHHRERKVK